MITPYVHAEHFKTLRLWNDARGQRGLEPWMLPDIGFVWNDNAMAFLVTTNSPVAWIAHWTVKPDLPRELRGEAFRALAGHAETFARERGFRLVQTLGKVGFQLSYDLRMTGYLAAPGEFLFLVKDLRS